VIAIVGDVKAKEIIPVLDRYFGRLPPGQTPARCGRLEPKAIAEKQVLKPDKAQPVYLEGYHRAAVTSPDDATYQAIAEVLGTGRTSRLYGSLVRDQKVAVQASVFPSFPGGKYPGLMVFFGIPAPGRTNEEVQAAIRAEIDKIRSQPVTDEELDDGQVAGQGFAGARTAEQHGDRAAARRGSDDLAATGARSSPASPRSTRSPRTTSSASPRRPSCPTTGPSR